MGDIERHPEEPATESPGVVVRVAPRIADVPAEEWDACATGVPTGLNPPAQPIRLPCFSEGPGGERIGHARHRLAAAAPPLRGRRGLPPGLHALLPEEPLAGRIRLRPRLGRGLYAGRGALLPQAPGLGALHPCRGPEASGARRCRSHRAPSHFARGRPHAHQRARRVVAAHHLHDARRVDARGLARLPQAHRPAVPLAESRLRQLRRLPRRPLLAQTQGHSERAAHRPRGRYRDRMGYGPQPDRDALGRILRLLHGHRRAQMGLALSQPRMLQPARRDHGRRDPARSRQLRRPLRGGRAQLRRRRHALWPLLGRHGGHDCLHFEVCYYQAIDYAIAHRLSRVEAGAQGAHKLARGYLPAETYSAHYIADPGLRRAVADFLERERRAVAHEAALLAEESPYRRDGG